MSKHGSSKSPTPRNWKECAEVLKATRTKPRKSGLMDRIGEIERMLKERNKSHA